MGRIADANAANTNFGDISDEDVDDNDEPMRTTDNDDGRSEERGREMTAEEFDNTADENEFIEFQQK